MLLLVLAGGAFVLAVVVSGACLLYQWARPARKDVDIGAEMYPDGHYRGVVHDRNDDHA